MSRITLVPSLHDWHDSAGLADGHYFWQDLMVAKLIFAHNPQNHLDVGSRVDGLIAHLLSFRKVDVLDIRPLQTQIDGLRFVEGDATDNLHQFFDLYDSVSCLHSIEHFGLGRYGDDIDPEGHIKGLKNISKCLVPGGHLYISIPLGNNAVQFNSQRMLLPKWPIEILENFKLVQYMEIPWKGNPFFNAENLEKNQFRSGSVGLYQFIRVS